MSDIKRDAKGQVGVSRIYIDYIQYAKAIGNIHSYDIASPMSGGANDTGQEAWDGNPAKIVRYYNTLDPRTNCWWIVYFKNYDAALKDKQFSNFMSSINYFGVLGHELGKNADGGITKVASLLQGEMTAGEGTTSESRATNSQTSPIVGASYYPLDLGFSLYEITEPYSDWYNVHYYGIYIYAPYDDDDYIDIGTFTAGRFFEFPHSANLSLNIKVDTDGIKSQRTMGGSTVQNISYYKQPNWGKYPAWTWIPYMNEQGLGADYSDTALNFTRVSQVGRRSWDLTWSFLDTDNTFTTSPTVGSIDSSSWETTSNMAGLFKHSDNSFTSKSTLYNMLNFSLYGKIPMIFQPDKTVKEFAKVIIDTKTLSIQQSAPNLYTCKLKLTEVW